MAWVLQLVLAASPTSKAAAVTSTGEDSTMLDNARAVLGRVLCERVLDSAALLGPSAQMAESFNTFETFEKHAIEAGVAPGDLHPVTGYRLLAVYYACLPGPLGASLQWLLPETSAANSEAVAVGNASVVAFVGRIWSWGVRNWIW